MVRLLFPCLGLSSCASLGPCLIHTSQNCVRPTYQGLLVEVFITASKRIVLVSRTPLLTNHYTHFGVGKSTSEPDTDEKPEFLMLHKYKWYKSTVYLVGWRFPSWPLNAFTAQALSAEPAALTQLSPHFIADAADKVWTLTHQPTTHPLDSMAVHKEE